jgi:hypothetical protein
MAKLETVKSSPEDKNDYIGSILVADHLTPGIWLGNLKNRYSVKEFVAERGFWKLFSDGVTDLIGVSFHLSKKVFEAYRFRKRPVHRSGKYADGRPGLKYNFARRVLSRSLSEPVSRHHRQV